MVLVGTLGYRIDCRTIKGVLLYLDDIFSPFKNDFVLLYLDDILVFSETEEEHEEHLKLVLDKLREYKLYAKFSKCGFWLKEVIYLGHIISAEGIKVDPSKVQAIVEWEPPQNVKQL